MKSKQPDSFAYIQELIGAAEDAVIGYENYLLDKIDSQQLAKLMKRLSTLVDARYDWVNEKKN